MGKYCRKCGLPINGDKPDSLCDNCIQKESKGTLNHILEYVKHHKWVAICIAAAILLYGVVIVPTALHGQFKVLSSIFHGKDYYELALAEYNSGNYEEAYRYIQQAKNPSDENVVALRNQIIPNYTDNLYTKAVIKKDEGNFIASYDLLVKILELDPHHEKANVLREEVAPQAAAQKEEQRKKAEEENRQKEAEREAERQRQETEKKAKLDKLLQENYFDGELAVAILKLDDVSDYYTYKYSESSFSDGDGTYYQVSKWSPQFGYDVTYKVYENGQKLHLSSASEKDASKHIEAKGVLNVRTDSVSEQEKPKNPGSSETIPTPTNNPPKQSTMDSQTSQSNQVSEYVGGYIYDAGYEYQYQYGYTAEFKVGDFSILVKDPPKIFSDMGHYHMSIPIGIVVNNPDITRLVDSGFDYKITQNDWSLAMSYTMANKVPEQILSVLDYIPSYEPVYFNFPIQLIDEKNPVILSVMDNVKQKVVRIAIPLSEAEVIY